MLPESKFPVTGGIMQTEEVLPRSQSTGLDTSLSERTTPYVPGTTSVHFSQPQPQPQTQSVQFPTLISSLEAVMAVKQEPLDEDERSHQSITLSPKTDAEDSQSIPSASPTSLKCLVEDQLNPEAKGSDVQLPQQNGCKKTVSRARRKSRWKLKFHHQALPPEYLDHYEATLAQQAATNNSSSSAPSTKSAPSRTIPQPCVINAIAPTSLPVTFPHALVTTAPATVDMRSWLQRLAAMQNEIYPGPTQMAPANLCQPSLGGPRRSVITSAQQPVPIQQHQQRAQQNQPRPPMKYSDLPYMGEITLDNSKPRRGRKPKKADICHLIYKNYGTILPGTPGLEDPSRVGLVPGAGRDNLGLPFQRSDIQNRISSLLEKRLTQERRGGLDACDDLIRAQEEPMNLCIRDLDLLKIRFSEGSSGLLGLQFSPKSEGSSDNEDSAQNLDHEQHTDLPNGKISHQVFKNMTFGGSDDGLVSNNINNGLRFQDCNGDISKSNGCGSDLVNNNNIQTNNNENNSDATTNQNSNLLYWPNAGVFIHPAALQSQLLYYQKLAQEKNQQPSLDPAKEQRLGPKSIYSILENDSKASTPVPSCELPTPSMQAQDTSARPQTKRNSNSQANTSTGQQPMKRKRSAIFIPPMPTDNNSNPTTEVSICKFKFTGGAKPSLQEKKSLSVDSGGNFRYYSGTGDKSMRGYEFFPREALQQSSNPTLGPAISSPSTFPNTPLERAPQMQNLSPPRAVQNQVPNQLCQQDDRGRKRKSRKSIEREKLEQTFKEKGFLIQTQQLESAEGATYCKFRQLRKFTRYLFRSWKDYLPGNVRELDQSGEPLPPSPMALKESEQEAETATTPMSPLSPQSVDLAPNLVIDSSPPPPPSPASSPVVATPALSLPIIN